MPLSQKAHYIFDMDGTLTVAVHDFTYIRQSLGLPADKPILESISARPIAEQQSLHQQLDELEIAYARTAKAQPDADTLLDKLSTAGFSLGILTRNSTQLAKITLECCGLLNYFNEAHILGRDICAPKPGPDGIHQLLHAWNANPQNAVIIGDFRFDLEAGRAAGITTVHFDVEGRFEWPELTDHCTQRLPEILELAGLAAN